MTNKEIVQKASEVANRYNTVYANGMFGQPITKSIIDQKAEQLPRWYTKSRKESLYGLIGQDYFGFDCVCFIKAILFWDWSGDINDVNGGAKYDGKTDVTEKGLLNMCSNVSSDFKKIEVGEYLYMAGHCGIYIGDGLAIECTPKWKNGVQITAVGNIGKISGLNSRKWEKHGKLPNVTYITEEENSEENVTIKLLTLQKGKYRGNEQIKTVQRILKSLSYYGMDIDGSFGTGTFYAVQSFQAERGLEMDGIVGKETWSELLKGY